ncbi:unnamed protein product [Rotaria magnacalcarata]|uniref:Uncharacterized protein n=1 Tax=Rotaria magnacalcarata TaxID=392030 RepID=A0A816RFS3_9BILA|nr:unnamed protein product [Rotaria magnacalcarata]CAF3985063.1 unnamed protein product [Rotaria magnacalcarata]
MPFDEAQRDLVKQLFHRSATATAARITSDTPTQALQWVHSKPINWELITSLNLMVINRKGCDVKGVVDRFDEVEEFDDDKIFHNPSDLVDIRWFLEKAREIDDPVWLVKAYTAGTGFYKAIRLALAHDVHSFRD